MSDLTLSRTETLHVGPQRKAGASANYLSLAFRAHAPRGEPVRIRLSSDRAWEVGRAAAVAADPARHRLDVADPAMSERHFGIEPRAGGFTLRDLGSKNGTSVNGERRAEHELADGDIVTAGNCWFVVRLHRRAPDDEVVVDGGALARRPAGLRTLHPSFAAQLAELESVAASPHPVLVLGETGTGKELVARAVHELSGRGGRFVAVNCAAIPPDLVAGELFGVSRGAYTGATADRTGLIRASDGGTFFLDEIGELGLPVQIALLRVLQERETLALGAAAPVRVDLRAVAATHRDLRAMCAAEEFREDLLARLAGLVVELPPLRARPEDLGLLIAAILTDAGVSGPGSFSPEAARLLFTHAWPRNVRELRNAVLGSTAVVGSGRIDAGDLAITAPATPTPPAGAERLRPAKVDRAALEALLEQHGGNISAVARGLSTSRTQVARLIERFGLAKPSR